MSGESMTARRSSGSAIILSCLGQSAASIANKCSSPACTWERTALIPKSLAPISRIRSPMSRRVWRAQRNLAPKLLADIAFSHHKATDAFQTPEVRPNHLPLPPSPIFQTQDELREGLKHLNLPVTSLLYKCVNAAKEPSQESATVPHTDHDGTDICGRCRSFYETFVAIAPGKCQTLEQITLEQNASHLWHDSHKVRITASSAKKVPIRGNPQCLLREHIYPRFHGNAATQHGVESEALALQRLEGCGYKVTCRGTVLCTHEPWLSASPDGVLHTAELLEIKCPLLKSNESLEARSML
ncbi:hypothetical protein SRHO_G00250570 [Serrasalmus rhombeus]